LLLDDEVKAALAALPGDIRAQVRVEMPMRTALRESALSRQARGGRSPVFPKKAEKTPGREIETALKRTKEVK
jgi:hypothetical protein